MKTRYIIQFTLLFMLAACHSSKNGMTEVKTPFSGNAYESNRRFFRAVASGESLNRETAKSKALLMAKQRLASSVQTSIKSVAETYMNDRKVEDVSGNFGERFQQLTREVMNTTISGAYQINEKTYQNSDKSYVVWVAMEARKKDVYRKLKELAISNTTLSEKDKQLIQGMIDKAIQETEDSEK